MNEEGIVLIDLKWGQKTTAIQNRKKILVFINSVVKLKYFISVHLVDGIPFQFHHGTLIKICV